MLGVALERAGLDVEWWLLAGEFWPIIFISIFLASVYGAITEVLLLLGFGVLVAGAARLALGACPPSLVRVVRDTLHTTGQAGVRASIFFLALLVFVAGDAGFEFVLGAFAAGLVVGLVLDSPEGRVVRLRLEGVGFGFLPLSTSSSRGWPSTSTASSPWNDSGNWSQPTATVFACLSRFRRLHICHRLPPVATAGLHKGSILCSLV